MRKTSLVVFSAIIVLIITGCSMGPKTAGTIPTATQKGQVVPTQESQQQATLPPAEAPTTAAAFTPEPYYIEEFEPDSPTSDYYSYAIPDANYSEGDFSYSADNGILTMDVLKLGGEIFFLYDAYTYSDVAVTVNVANHGDNTGIVSLICRYNQGQGWYEFIVEPAGLFAFVDVHYDNGVPAYDYVYNGGSGKIKPGAASNSYSLTCINQTMTLYVNGFKVWAQDISSSLPQYAEGQVGFGVATQDALPVSFGFDNFIIQQP